MQIKTERSYISRLVCAIILISPLMDVASYWCNHLGINNALTLGLRLLFLMILAFLGFSIAPSKKPYIILGTVLLLFTGGHIIACMQLSYASPWADLTNLIRIYMLPITTLCFITFLQTQADFSSDIRQCLVVCLLLIALTELLSVITGTNPYTYPNKAIGILGWFFFANCQSAILTILVPIGISWISRKNLSAAIKFSILGFVMLYLLATRLAYLGLVLSGFSLGIVFILRAKESKFSGFVLLGLTVLFILLLPVSPMKKNQTLVAENAVKKQQLVDQLVAADEAEARNLGLSEDEIKTQQLQSAYMEFLPGLVDTFGLQRTAQKYDFSTKASDIADVRRAKITYSKLLLEDSPMLSQYFGMDLNRWRYKNITYDVENDLHGIFFLCGGVGLALMLGFLLYFAIGLLLALKKKTKALLSPDLIALCVACLSCGTHIYATSGVLRRPNVSFYLAICLALVWYHTKQIKLAHSGTSAPAKE